MTSGRALDLLRIARRPAHGLQVAQAHDLVAGVGVGGDVDNFVARQSSALETPSHSRDLACCRASSFPDGWSELAVLTRNAGRARWQDACSRSASRVCNQAFAHRFRNLMPGSRIVRFLHTFGTASYTSSHTLEVVAVGADLPCCKPFRHLAVESGWFVSFSTTAATAGDLATG